LAIPEPGATTTSGERSRGSNRVNRGGSWNNNPANCRLANRNRNTPSNRNNNLGFRLARIPSRSRRLPEGTDSSPARLQFWRRQNAF
ncbi:MAG: SUMF1/EgtB/PvdO family nonheme iron enzyme, partial [Planctomycetaceae bacterium]|nr:SUMF1/EgtB/PvdO family nonheme iron enzyme [Planctomycetaceae bacterium]